VCLWAYVPLILYVYRNIASNISHTSQVQEQSTIRERLIRKKQERQINHLQQQVQQLQQGVPGSSEIDQKASTLIKPPRPMKPQGLSALEFDRTIDSAVEKLGRTRMPCCWASWQRCKHMWTRWGSLQDPYEVKLMKTIVGGLPCDGKRLLTTKWRLRILFIKYLVCQAHTYLWHHI
jgi:hypothetical protein